MRHSLKCSCWYQFGIALNGGTFFLERACLCMRLRMCLCVQWQTMLSYDARIMLDPEISLAVTISYHFYWFNWKRKGEQIINAIVWLHCRKKDTHIQANSIHRHQLIQVIVFIGNLSFHRKCDRTTQIANTHTHTKKKHYIITLS